MKILKSSKAIKLKNAGKEQKKTKLIFFCVNLGPLRIRFLVYRNLLLFAQPFVGVCEARRFPTLCTNR